MSKKTSAKSAIKTPSTRIEPISVGVKNYQQALDLYRKHNSLPTFLYLLENALDAGVRFQSLEAEMVRLIDINDDQYFGVRGSEYFRKYGGELRLVSKYRLGAKHTLSVCSALWGVFAKIQSENIYINDRGLIGGADLRYLGNRIINRESTNVAQRCQAAEEPSAPILSSDTESLMSDAFRAQEIAERSRDELVKNYGKPMVPWAALCGDLSDQPDLSIALTDLSKYIASYYVQADNFNLPGAEFLCDPIKVDNENAKALARIAGFLIFGRLFKHIVYAGQSFNFHSFFSERIEYLSKREALDHGEDQAEYIIAISNLLMIAAKLGVGAVEQGIVTEKELLREYLFDVKSKNINLAGLLPIPDSGFVQILASAFEPDLGDSIANALSLADYGVRTSWWDSALFDEMFEGAYGGIDKLLMQHLREKVEGSAKRWLIPLQCTKAIADIYRDFWSDGVILEKISNTLFEVDRVRSSNSKFLSEELDGHLWESWEPPSLGVDVHPLIFARRFANKKDFIEFKDSEWVAFCQSLINAGQIRHACTVLALFFRIEGTHRFLRLNSPFSIIDIPEMVKTLSQLAPYKSFSLIQCALLAFFDSDDEIPEKYNGSLKEFLPIQREVPGSVRVLPFEKNRKALIEKGFDLAKLSEIARKYLISGYATVDDEHLAIFDVNGGNAVFNFFLAIESELRFRSPDIDEILATELGFLRVDLSRVKRAGYPSPSFKFRGLGSIKFTLDIFSKLSPAAQEKLFKFQAITIHEDFRVFQAFLRELIDIRNSFIHPDGKEIQRANQLSRVQELMFGRKGLIQFLCNTA
jgi:hypothetical protein